MMKKARLSVFSKSDFFFTFAVSAALMLFSAGCSNPSAELVMPDYDKTVRAQSLARAESAAWTAELDPQILTPKKDAAEQESDPNVSPLSPPPKKTDVKKTDADKDKPYSIRLPEGAFLSNGKKLPSPIYPSLPGFGSLDINEINATERTLITSFLAAVKNKKIDDTFFATSSSFYVPVLNYEFQFFPEITGWKIGKPYIGVVAGSEKQLYEVPVRLYAQKQHSDMTLYLERNEKSVLIEQCVFGDFTDGR